jgi:hypothetical protein
MPVLQGPPNRACYKHTCAIQRCLADSNYDSRACAWAIDALKSCCRQPFAAGSLHCAFPDAAPPPPPREELAQPPTQEEEEAAAADDPVEEGASEEEGEEESAAREVRVLREPVPEQGTAGADAGGGGS